MLQLLPTPEAPPPFNTPFTHSLRRRVYFYPLPPPSHPGLRIAPKAVSLSVKLCSLASTTPEDLQDEAANSWRAVAHTVWKLKGRALSFLSLYSTAVLRHAWMTSFKKPNVSSSALALAASCNRQAKQQYRKLIITRLKVKMITTPSSSQNKQNKMYEEVYKKHGADLYKKKKKSSVSNEAVLQKGHRLQLQVKASKVLRNSGLQVICKVRTLSCYLNG